MKDEIERWVESAVVVPVPEETQVAITAGAKGEIDAITEALTTSPIGDAIGYNEFESAPYVRGVLPWAEKAQVRPWIDLDDSCLIAYLQTNYCFKNERAMQHALNIAFERNRFNPVIDMFDNLPDWDGTERAGHLLHWFLGAEDDAYTQEVERLMFAGIIMRTYNPGTKFDYMPVIIGEQGCGKSTFAKMLALHDEFFTDCLTGIGTKEGAELVQGKLIIEIAELDAIRGKALETTKAFISRTSDDYRTPYAKRPERHPRRFVLIGTTNTHCFLADPSGNRRFLPVKCSIYTPKLSLFDDSAKNVINQAWAEMLHFFRRSGSLPVILSSEGDAGALREQHEATQDDPRIGMIREWLDNRALDERVCVIQICEDVLETPRGNRKQWLETEVSEIMRRHFPEWKRLEKKQRVAGYGTQRAYQREIAEP